MISWSIILYLSEWVVRLVMLLVVVTRRRDPVAAMSWLLVIAFMPFVGLVLYVMIGERRLPSRRLKRHMRLLSEIQGVSRDFVNDPNIVHPEMGERATAAVLLAEHLGHMPILGGNAVELMSRTEDVIDRLVADIDAAKQHVHLLFYIFAQDATGRRVAEALGRAAARGVKCRVLVDSAGSRKMVRRLGPGMRRAGVQLHEALPVGVFRRKFARIDLRNHRKIAVIDGRIAYAGSQNIVDAGYGHKDLVWYDLMVRLTGPAVLELQVVFIGDWYEETGEMLPDEEVLPEPSLAGTVPVQVLPSGPNYPSENYQRIVVAALYTAQKCVVITTPYFVPDQALMQAIEVAVLRGVEVKLIVPRRSDQRLVGAASRAYYGDALAAGAEVYLYEDGLLHAKTVSIDHGLAFIGSSNFDIRSFALNFEINLLFYDADVNRRLREEQDGYLERCSRVTLDEWRARPAVKRLWENTARLLSPLL
jgi:cardiolipin synthase A/B